MKKVIAAAAGLMLVGTMVGSASAAVSFSGDARARGLYQSNYDVGQSTADDETGAVTRNNEKDNRFTSRFRLQARAEAAGGAYAIGRADIGNGVWDGGASGTADVGASKAYIGVPMGMTLLEAALIVVLVIYLFLGSLRVVIIPLVAIPLSLIGVIFLINIMGFSLNLLTLLAMVIAIGLVVDDAIVVVENVHRHIEEGATPMEAALKGAREVALPVIAMTLTLAAVFAPISFVGGLTGKLFSEFALTLAGAVFISGIVALTLSPMMLSLIHI